MSRTSPRGRRRGFAAFWSFLLGGPLAAGILWAALAGPLQGTVVERYLHHPVEWAEVVLVCVALIGIWLRLLRTRTERMALVLDLVPPWNGEPVPVSKVGELRQLFHCQPRRMRETLLGRRIASILDFVAHRRTAAGLDDHIRTLADNDAIAQETSGTLTRFIIWAVPILGFLGTVLGITGAVAGITPDKLENNLNQVTDGLALAFDATALALGMTMVVMLCNALVDRKEQAILEEVDQFIEQQLAHRFERAESAGGDPGLWRHEMAELVKRQAALWADALAQTDRKRAEAESQLHDRLQASLTAALERTQEAHARRLTELEKQSAKHLTALTAKIEELARSAAGHAETLQRIHEGERQLLALQQALQQNLQALTGAGAFEQAVHSLTAAIHLLTSQSLTARGARPGAAA